MPDKNNNGSSDSAFNQGRRLIEIAAQMQRRGQMGENPGTGKVQDPYVHNPPDQARSSNPPPPPANPDQSAAIKELMDANKEHSKKMADLMASVHETNRDAFNNMASLLQDMVAGVELVAEAITDLKTEMAEGSKPDTQQPPVVEPQKTTAPEPDDTPEPDGDKPTPKPAPDKELSIEEDEEQELKKLREEYNIDPPPPTQDELDQMQADKEIRDAMKELGLVGDDSGDDLTTLEIPGDGDKKDDRPELKPLPTEDDIEAKRNEEKQTDLLDKIYKLLLAQDKRGKKAEQGARGTGRHQNRQSMRDMFQGAAALGVTGGVGAAVGMLGSKLNSGLTLKNATRVLKFGGPAAFLGYPIVAGVASGVQAYQHDGDLGDALWATGIGSGQAMTEELKWLGGKIDDLISWGTGSDTRPLETAAEGITVIGGKIRGGVTAASDAVADTVGDIYDKIRADPAAADIDDQPMTHEDYENPSAMPWPDPLMEVEKNPDKLPDSISEPINILPEPPGYANVTPRPVVQQSNVSQNYNSPSIIEFRGAYNPERSVRDAFEFHQ